MRMCRRRRGRLKPGGGKGGKQNFGGVCFGMGADFFEGKFFLRKKGGDVKKSPWLLFDLTILRLYRIFFKYGLCLRRQLM